MTLPGFYVMFDDGHDRIVRSNATGRFELSHDGEPVGEYDSIDDALDARRTAVHPS